MEPAPSNITTSFAQKIVKQVYGLEANVKRLAGEVDFNFYIKSKANQKYILKISRVGVSKSDLQLEKDIMSHVNRKNLNVLTPVNIPTIDGLSEIEIQDEFGEKRWIRMQSWIEGRMLGEVTPLSNGLRYEWGQVCGELSNALQDFHSDLGHRFYKWNPSETLYSKKYLKYFSSEEQRQIANYFWNNFENETLPEISKLRKSINYNDAHEMNLIVNEDKINPKIIGVIDFGDALYCETVNELAIACAYAGMDCIDPLSAMACTVKGYHAKFPLEEIEVHHLFNFIAARLLITVSSAAYNKHKEPENAYLQVSEKGAWELLHKLFAICPKLAEYTFRESCNWEPCPLNFEYKKWLESENDNIESPIKLLGRKLAPLDLSVGSLSLGHHQNVLNIDKFEKRIHQMIKENGGDIGIGGYLETRPIYTADEFQVEGDNGFKSRTVHLGLDFWTSCDEPVLAPLDGIVYSVYDNDAEGDYGPTLILKHQPHDGLVFYTLYGHLRKDVLHKLVKGQQVKKGDVIAHVGAASENGHWPPHLHFQIMLDILDNTHDFPGVSFPSQKNLWKSLCPDPNVWIKFDSHKNKLKSDKALLARRQRIIGRGMSISYNHPLHIVRGYKQYLYNTNGQRFLDTCNNVAHVGHEHERVIEAAHQQNSLLNTNTRYLHENIINYAEELLQTLPPELSVVHFVNSGSEANDLALRMVQSATHRKDMLALEVGYHGHTQACIDVSSYKFDGKGGVGAPMHTGILPMPDMYRGIYSGQENAVDKYMSHVDKAIEEVKKAGRNVAGFIGESILSCGGQIVLPKDYLKYVFEKVRNEGGLCIIDEVQVGFGRVGEKFWSFELHDVIPDIVTMGKPIGNGHPLAAVVTTEAVADAFANGMEYFNTFGGNPVSCAIGSEVLNVIRDEGLQQNALKVGAYFLEQLEQLKNQYSIIGDVRGHGFFLGIELIKNHDTMETAGEEASYLINRMKDRGILMSSDGPQHNVIKIKPPMCFDKADADFLISNFDVILKEDFLQV